MFVLFGIFLVQSFFEFRTFGNLAKDHLIERNLLPKIGTVSFFLNLLTTIFFANHRMIIATLAILRITLLFSLPTMIRWYREQQFRKGLYLLMTKIILKMQTGVSFRQSLGIITNSSDPFSQQKLSKILDIVTYSQQGGAERQLPFIENLITDLKIADRQPHLALKILRNTARRIKVEDDFRRKSKQASRQARIQSFMLTILYFATAIFVANRFDFNRISGPLGLSFALFIVGSSWTLLSGRSHRWKV